MTTSLLFGHPVHCHRLEVPEDYAHPERGSIQLFAREIAPAEASPDTPTLLFLQGGPGFPSPRPAALSGWLGELLLRYRVVLLDQRGTGHSSRIDAHGPIPTAEELACYRADSIVRDAEALREYLGVRRWTLFGQSFGGFCITHYLSAFPESVERAYLTGGLPGIRQSAEEIYRHTYAALARRHQEFYRRYPWCEDRIREICLHLENEEETLPTGERLSARRFRTIGIELGRGAGMENLAYLLEDPFHQRGGGRRLRGDVLAEVGRRVSFVEAPLYAVLHESIYGGTVPGPTAWAAARVAEEIPGYSPSADPRATEEPFYLYGEHIFPWLFEEDPALSPFAGVAEELAQRTDWPCLYDEEALAEGPATCAAAIYVDDVFVPRELSLETASCFRDLRPWITNEFHHNGIHVDGARILRRLISLAEDF
ncbi:alpha/beta hydrolase [Corynebacterium uropygiale]|uniref:Alpha/beta hydrolase n=1 Tax=Corynebacterium uropygiale TaxID=1775911 RepID=A0A9X1TYS5_9CORY|nr:alpha/beta fold hydrolase [Corynebacterium uropygiale]MCF4006156.1 alpha/beta hydrolase [Corynebacterium uropygiale]